MIEEFWIINLNGICLFHRSIYGKEFKVEDQLFSGLLSAILQMYSELSSSQIQKLEGGEGKFLFFGKQNLIYIVKTKINSDDKKIKKKIEQIQDLFINKFHDELEKFEGDVTSFKQFEKDLDLIFKEISKPEKWGKGLIDL
jgi:hypothetical protein